MLTVPTTCPFCGCGCGFYLLAAKGQLVGTAPSENHPVSAGRLCARGWAAHEAVLWGRRLRKPLLRLGGVLEPVGWAAALDQFTGRVKELLDAGKPIGVLGSARATNEENYLATKLARLGFGTNNVDFAYHSLCRPVLDGLADVAGSFTPSITLQDVESSAVILLLEGDLADTHPQAASSVMRALERGARLITVGCRRTQMARLSSLNLEAAPGSEGGVITGLVAEVAHQGWRDDAEGPRPGAGVEATQVTEGMSQAADWIAGAERAVFLVPPLPGPGGRCRRTAAAVASLAAVTGHLDRRGSGILPLLARSNARGACDMGVAPDRLPGYEPLPGGPAQQRLERLWGKPLPSASGMDAETLIQSVSGLLVLADDPAAILRMGRRATDALARLEFLAVLDSFFTPTAELAHLALPISSFAETEGTFTSMEGRVQRLRPAIDPPELARPGWSVLAELCARFDAGASYDSAADVLREIAQAVPRYDGAERVLGQGWSNLLTRSADGAKPVLHVTPTQELTSPGRPYVLAYNSFFEWGCDPLVSFSPTLSRDFRSQRKLSPNGFVEVCQRDADKLGLHAGRARLTSACGEAVLSIRFRPDLKPGVLLVPYAFRDEVARVLGGESATAVSIEQV